eukprot:TRINITY_DN9901_c0_g1_i2.p1 TRINITY_DN9901_c0_g1~~TRINITY_DN9901_c0_g1_i2.p1  ORF type:complete len:387 (+),score=87.65 TRINITY_DN9901_c0_g1_i2:95-1255(+)
MASPMGAPMMAMPGAHPGMMMPCAGMAPTMPPMMVPMPPPPHPGQMPMPMTMPAGNLGPPPVSTTPTPASGATVSLAIDNLPFRYQLSEADLRETFQRWGTVQSVQVLRDGSREVGVVNFADQVDASDAQRQLTGQSCNFDGATGALAVVLGGPDQLRGPGQTGPAPGMGPPMGAPPGAMPGAPPQGPCAGAMPKNGNAANPGKGDGKGMQPANPPAPRPAWCCKIVVEAESLHPEFPTVLRIIGEGGANVEHIRSQTKCTVALRGRGSGTQEPETGQELQEPMFLWLTSDSADNGKSALEMCQDLLKSIYEGHQQWCEQNGIMHPNFIKPKVVENPEVLPSAGAAPAAPALPAAAPAAPGAQVGLPGQAGFGPCGGKGGFQGKGY